MLKFTKFYKFTNLQNSRANTSRIFRIKNAKFLVYCFYMNTNCISVPLMETPEQCMKSVQSE